MPDAINWTTTLLVALVLATLTLGVVAWRLRDYLDELEEDMNDLEEHHPWLWDDDKPKPWAAESGRVQEPPADTEEYVPDLQGEGWIADHKTHVDPRDVADVTAVIAPDLGWTPNKPVMQQPTITPLRSKSWPSLYRALSEDLLGPQETVLVDASDDEPPFPDPLDEEVEPEPETAAPTVERFTFYFKPSSKVIHARAHCMIREYPNVVWAQNITLAEASSMAREQGCWPCRRCKPWGYEAHVWPGSTPLAIEP